MAKVPTHAEQLTDKAAIERRTQVLHDIGLLVASWNHLELYLEVAIMRATRLSPLHASILLGGLQHKAKVSILYTLLREEGKPEAIRKLKVALGYAKRNALMHGVPASEDGFTKVAFYHRTVGDKYSVVKHEYSPDEFHDHVWNFTDLANEALIELGIDGQDEAFAAELLAYGQAARFEGLD